MWAVPMPPVASRGRQPGPRFRIVDGDALTVQGALKAETYEKDGVTKLSLSIIADRVLTLRQPARKQADVETSNSGSPARRDAVFNDALPF